MSLRHALVTSTGQGPDDLLAALLKDPIRELPDEQPSSAPPEPRKDVPAENRTTRHSDVVRSDDL
jgi:hypothetical protein